MHQLMRRLRRLIPVAVQLRVERLPPDLERVEFAHGLVAEVAPLLARMIREERTASAAALRSTQAERDAALAAIPETQETAAVAVEAARREAASEQARAAGLERQLCEVVGENTVLRAERDTGRAERDVFRDALYIERERRSADEALRALKPAGRA